MNETIADTIFKEQYPVRGAIPSESNCFASATKGS